MRRLAVAVAVTLLSGALAVAPAAARNGRKAIFGPLDLNGASAFPTYQRLGVGIYQTELRWDTVASRRPAAPRDPADPAYAWPASLDDAVARARGAGMDVAVVLDGFPGWANGGRDFATAPSDPQDYARFAAAASRRYPGVRYWLILDEPTRADRFSPAVPERSPLTITPAETVGPRTYARLLDAAYGALKAVRRTNVVVGGMTFTVGVTSPYNWIRSMRLPDGRPPRMDLYGHNAFSARAPHFGDPPLIPGEADFSDVPRLEGWVDRYLRRPGRPRLRLYIAEFFAPTDHANREFNFWVTRPVQRRWMADALRIMRAERRIAVLGTFLLDEAPTPAGDEVDRGLMTFDGVPKPAFAAFASG